MQLLTVNVVEKLIPGPKETGFTAKLEGLVGVYDNKFFASMAAYQFYIVCFRGRITGGGATPWRTAPNGRSQQ